MTIHKTIDAVPTHTTVAVSEASLTSSSFAQAYAHYLALRSRVLAGADTLSDRRLAELLDQEEKALCELARAPVSSVEDFGLKAGLLVGLLEGCAVRHTVTMLAGALVSDVRLL